MERQIRQAKREDQDFGPVICNEERSSNDRDDEACERPNEKEQAGKSYAVRA